MRLARYLLYLHCASDRFGLKQFLFKHGTAFKFLMNVKSRMIQFEIDVTCKSLECFNTQSKLRGFKFLLAIKINLGTKSQKHFGNKTA